MRTTVAAILAFAAFSAALVSAQPQGLPRTEDGHPDLQGTYDIASMTPLERAPGTPLVMTKEEAAALERQRAERVQRLALPSNGDRNAPPAGGDGSTGAAGNVGGYNNFWVDNGTEYYTIDGQKRMSVIVDPPDGRVPALTPQARQRAASRVARPTSDAQENDPGFEGPSAYDDLERRPLGERCLLGFGSTSGPPDAAGALQPDLHQIVQTRDTVLILNEMVHDARDRPHRTASTCPGRSASGWATRSAAGRATRWSSTPPTSPTRRGSARSSENLHVVERFSPDRRRYAALPVHRRGSLHLGDSRGPANEAWPATNDLLFEYACHEGNYALGEHPARRTAERA